MNILCKIFGHQPPVYSKKGWYSPGEEYAKTENVYEDGVGRIHCEVWSECPRCGARFKVCRIHADRSKKETELEEQLRDASEALMDYQVKPYYNVAFDNGAKAAGLKYKTELQGGGVMPIRLVGRLITEYHEQTNLGFDDFVQKFLGDNL